MSTIHEPSQYSIDAAIAPGLRQKLQIDIGMNICLDHDPLFYGSTWELQRVSERALLRHVIVRCARFPSLGQGLRKQPQTRRGARPHRKPNCAIIPSGLSDEMATDNRPITSVVRFLSTGLTSVYEKGCALVVASLRLCLIVMNRGS